MYRRSYLLWPPAIVPARKSFLGSTLRRVSPCLGWSALVGSVLDVALWRVETLTYCEDLSPLGQRRKVNQSPTQYKHCNTLPPWHGPNIRVDVPPTRGSNFWVSRSIFSDS